LPVAHLAPSAQRMHQLLLRPPPRRPDSCMLSYLSRQLIHVDQYGHSSILNSSVLSGFNNRKARFK
jgi:hypothetical protein